MKSLFSILGCLLCGAAIAQMPAMSEQDMQRMMGSLMQSAQQMQACISGIDQEAIQTLSAEGMSIQESVSSLCDAGDRAAAQSLAMDYVQKIKNHSEVKKLMECGEMARPLIGDMPFQQLDDVTSDDGTKHVCDINR